MRRTNREAMSPQTRMLLKLRETSLMKGPKRRVAWKEKKNLRSVKARKSPMK